MKARALWIARKELLHLKRDPFTVAVMVVLPLMNLLLFGYAINTDVRHIPTVVFDQDQSARSRDLASSLQATGFYELVGDVDSYAGIERCLKSGTARVGLVIPPEYASDVTRRRPTKVQLVVDGSDPQIVANAVNTAASLVSARSSALTAQRRTAGHTPQLIDVEPVTWFNPDLRTPVFIVPGMVGVILTMTMVVLTAMSIVRERERGNLEQLIVSPVRGLELVVGKILPYVLIGYGQMTLILGAGHLVFDVPVVGSLGLLYAVAFLFIAANLTLGLFFSTLAGTQQQAMQMSFFFLLPNILLSGFMFPLEGMPEPAQWLAQTLPLTHFLTVVRGITLKGSGLSDVAPELPWLFGILVVFLLLTLLRFEKKLA